MNVLAPKLKSAEEIDKQTQENAELMERTYERLRETETELHSANRNNLRRLISQLVLLSPHYNLIGIGVNKYLSLKKIFVCHIHFCRDNYKCPKCGRCTEYVMMICTLFRDVNAIAEFNSLLSGSCRFVASLCSICASCDTLTQIVLCGTNDELADIGYLVEEVRCFENSRYALATNESV